MYGAGICSLRLFLDVWLALLSCSTPQDLPWSFKVFYGLLSDTVPIRGKRRKPYYLIGWALFLVANASLALIGCPTIGTVMVLVRDRVDFVNLKGNVLDSSHCRCIHLRRAEAVGRV
jgi:hypothetical protein